MPSVNVPLKGQPGWDELMSRRRAFWRQRRPEQTLQELPGHEFACHDRSPVRHARPGMVKLCRVFLEPMRAKFGTAYVLSAGTGITLYNRAIGGARHASTSMRTPFESVAADMRFAKGSPAQWTTEAKKLRAKTGGKGGIGRYDRTGFIHLDSRGYAATWSG